jgi:hypothetical protein
MGKDLQHRPFIVETCTSLLQLHRTTYPRATAWRAHSMRWCQHGRLWPPRPFAKARRLRCSVLEQSITLKALRRRCGNSVVEDGGAQSVNIHEMSFATASDINAVSRLTKGYTHSRPDGISWVSSK